MATFLSICFVFAVFLHWDVVVGNINKDDLSKSSASPYASSTKNWGTVHNITKPLPDSMSALPRRAISGVTLGQECNSYKNFSNPDRAKRAVTSVDGGQCDRNDFIPSWYRFTGDAGDRMATSCVPILRCTSASTGWMNGLHPINSGIVAREVCFNWNENCCDVKVNIRVKLCHGFYIYELPALKQCNLRYCGNAVGPMNKPSRCGGEVTNLTGQITSPGYPTYMEPISCTWTIKSPFDGKILLYFESMILGHGGCFSNNLTVEGEKTQTFCYRKDLNPFSILVAKGTVNIYFKSVYWNKKPGFKLRYLMLQDDLDNVQSNNQWNISTHGINQSTIRVSWKKFDNSYIKPGQKVYGLVVVCKPLTRIKRSVHVMARPSDTTIEITGLTGGTQYKVQVVALVNGGNTVSVSMYGSDTKTITTRKGECEIYKNLTSSRRSQSFPGGTYCDQNSMRIAAWYRFAGQAGTQIATSCIPKDRCFTSSPGWMDGTHPLVEDGAVMRTVCFHRLGDCCRWEVSIKVRNCGGFYVYQLHSPPMCHLAYCGNKGGCGKFINDTTGAITSSGYPKTIYWNSKCLWDIEAPSSSGAVVVVVEDLRVPGSTPCLKFSLSFENNIGKQIGEACGVQRFFSWVSKGSAKLKFLSGKTYDSRWIGFKARYFVFSDDLTKISDIPQWTGCTAQTINSTSITVRWDPYSALPDSPPVTEYIVICVPDGLPFNATIFTTDVSQNSLVVTGLMAYTNYTVQIVVQSNGKNSSFNDYRGSQKTRITTKEGVPSKGPSHIKVASASRNRNMVSWQPIPKHARNGIITHYVIYYKEATNATAWIKMTVTRPIVNGTLMITYLEGLVVGKYVMQMAGATSVGVGIKSKPVYFTAEMRATTPPPTPTLPPAPEKGLDMYPYGESAGDSMVPNTSDYIAQCLRVDIPDVGMPFFKKQHHYIHICRNGLLRFEKKLSIYWPKRFIKGRKWQKDNPLLAPYWSMPDHDSFITRGISKVYYQTYNDTDNSWKSRQMILQATYDVENLHLNKSKLYDGDHTKPTNFKAKWVLVITWVNLRQKGSDKNNTFQAVLITDGIYSFALYNYPPNGIQWVAPSPRGNNAGFAVVGWNVGERKLEYYSVRGSGQQEIAVNIASQKGKSVKIDLEQKKNVSDQISKGKWMFRLETDPKGPKQECINWYNTHPYHKDYAGKKIPCPCTRYRASSDSRFNMTMGWSYKCTKSVFNDEGWNQKCCYGVSGALVKGYPRGGYPISSYEKNGTNYDDYAYAKCCVESISCNLFYAKRPSDNCTNYIHPTICASFCDPHFVTLDGRNYTFNGLGEYIMADVSEGFFKLQARTKLVEAGGKATVFVSAVAKQTGTSAVQVNLKSGKGIEVLVNGTLIDINTLTKTPTRYNVSIALSRPDNSSITVLFPCGISVKMTNVKDSLVILLAAPQRFKNKTRGLLGVWNDDPLDDLTTPAGHVLPTNATGRMIHFEFGQKWQVTEVNSLFKYQQGENASTFSNPSFVPMFLEDFQFTNNTLKQEALVQCEGDVNCLFDAALTNDITIGISTKMVGSRLKNELEALKNSVPRFLNDSSIISLTVNTTARIKIVAKDDDGDPLTFNVSGIRPKELDINRDSLESIVLSWDVTLDEIKLEFTVVDNQGAAALWRPTIYLCACHNGGYCYPDANSNVFLDSSNDHFLVMQCNCINGYSGKFCENDLDACQANVNPCYPGVKCTDLPPPADVFGYECGPCPDGFLRSGDGKTCSDLDECDDSGKHGCDQICVNTPGSFVCDCNQGFGLSIDQKTCNDIDECIPSSDCMQICNNTRGSYTCECDAGFKVDPNNRKKCVPKLPCTDGNHGCQRICYVKDGAKQCACYQGFKLRNDEKSCQDIDECEPTRKRCSQYCNNTDGSYTCWCKKGFRLDKDLITCDDVDECMELTYQCPDPSQICFNTEGTYKCVCGLGLYLTVKNTCREIDGVLPTKRPKPPPQPTDNERNNSINITIEGLNVGDWYVQLDTKFKEAVATAVTSYCATKDEDCKKDRIRERRALDYILYTADQVRLLPGFPIQINPKPRDLTAVIAFYVNFPLEVVSTSGDSIEGGILVIIVQSFKTTIEKALNRSISSVTWFNNTKEQPTTSSEPPEPESILIYVIIAVLVFVAVVIGVAVFVIRHVCKKRREKRGQRGQPARDVNNQAFDDANAEGEAFQFRTMSTENILELKDGGNQYVQVGTDNPDMVDDYSEVGEKPKLDEKISQKAEKPDSDERYSQIPEKPASDERYSEIPEKPDSDERYSEIPEKPYAEGEYSEPCKDEYHI